MNNTEKEFFEAVNSGEFLTIYEIKTSNSSLAISFNHVWWEFTEIREGQNNKYLAFSGHCANGKTSLAIHNVKDIEIIRKNPDIKVYCITSDNGAVTEQHTFYIRKIKSE